MERKSRRRRRRWRWRSGAVNETETLGKDEVNGEGKDDKRNVKSKKQKGRRNKSVCGSGGGRARGIYQMGKAEKVHDIARR